MEKHTITTLTTVDAEPVKSFFVNMLTRDIPLFDAILDLLDNCVDGIVRSQGKKDSVKPYEGFHAQITFDANSFTISDNCGGIPSSLMEYAFRLGRPNDRPADSKGSVGVYGIGMKRAIFKLGRNCLITTQNAENRFEVKITSDWLDQEDNWKIPLTHHQRLLEEGNGTVISVSELYDNISAQMGPDKENFSQELIKLIETHYAFIMEKGFEVTINGKPLKPMPTKLLFWEAGDESVEPGAITGIRPFIYKSVIEDVEVFLTVGFTRPIPSTDDIVNDQDEKRFRSSEAGWTIICNDRAIVYRDRTELTGWGEATVPSYHTQFIAIAGIVEFKSSDPSRLPTTTTKRGIDSSSRLYLQVKNKMREGMLLFTTYTNKWKGDAESTKQHFSQSRLMALDEIKVQSEKLSFTEVRNNPLGGNNYKPVLPAPPKVASNEVRVAYKVVREDFKQVAAFLLSEQNPSPSEVGQASFRYALRKAR